jgi:hypothetical protein
MIVGISSRYGLDIVGSEFESRYDQEFSLLHVVQTGSGASLVSYVIETDYSSPWVNLLGREADPNLQPVLRSRKY